MKRRKIDNRKVVAYVCSRGENAIDNLKGDALLVIGCGFGDSGRSGMVAAYGDNGNDSLYRLGNDAPYRFAYYSCNGEECEAIERLLSLGCRSIIVDFGIGTEVVRAAKVLSLSRMKNLIIATSETTGLGRGRIRPDLKVGELARLAFSTYFQSKGCDPAEIVRLQDGNYCHDTFILNSTMPVLVPVKVIKKAPEGSHVGEAGFYHEHYWVQEYGVGGVKYRVTNDWKEPTKKQQRDNRTPLEDWIRRMGLNLDVR